MAKPEPVIRLGLVGSGSPLVSAIEGLREVPNVAIMVVADVSGQSEGARLARSLSISLVANPMDVFRTDAEIILEVNGDDRQYERLLAVKPARVEVMSARGARLLVDLFKRSNGGPPGGGVATRIVVIVEADQPKLHDYLRRGFAGVRDVEVVLDRRQTERRQRLRAQASERRRGADRRRQTIDAQLCARGFAIARWQ